MNIRRILWVVHFHEHQSPSRDVDAYVFIFGNRQARWRSRGRCHANGPKRMQHSKYASGCPGICVFSNFFVYKKADEFSLFHTSVCPQDTTDILRGAIVNRTK